jgi:hypothetical protein
MAKNLSLRAQRGNPEIAASAFGPLAMTANLFLRAQRGNPEIAASAFGPLAMLKAVIARCGISCHCERSDAISGSPRRPSASSR